MTLSDLPKIQIIRNVRSTRLRLRVDQTEIRLTAPIFCTKSQIQKFIDQSEQWLIETWQKQQEKIIHIDKTLPRELRLFNLDEPLSIIYQPQKKSFILNVENYQLGISDRQPGVYLIAFVIAYARQHLPVYLQEVSQACDLPYGKCSIRQPKTRWGSCTSKHDIMLNSGLVLFPRVITRYVCVHELAHTQYFDHSASFWSEVQKYDVDFQNHQKILKTSSMPWWW